MSINPTNKTSLNKNFEANNYTKLKQDIQNILNQTKEDLESYANSLLALAYWQIGKRIEQEKLSRNANYYSSILTDLEIDLNITKDTLNRTVKFFRTYPNQEELKNLSWSHYRKLIAINNEEKRKELEEKCQKQGWSIQKLVSEIKNLEINKKEEATNQTPLTRPVDANYLYKAQIKEVVDGDTLILLIDLGFQVIKEQRVRLNQIDAESFNRSKESGKSYLKSEEKNTKTSVILPLSQNQEKVKENPTSFENQGLKDGKNEENQSIDSAKTSNLNGAKAYDYIRNLASNLDFVVVKTNKIDIYGRYLADIFYPLNETQKTQIEVFENGVYLNEELWRLGLVGRF
jgi:predicted nuclease of restriction endonuclease-like (RecB) superfamily